MLTQKRNLLCKIELVFYLSRKSVKYQSQFYDKEFYCRRILFYFTLVHPVDAHQADGSYGGGVRAVDPA